MSATKIEAWAGGMSKPHIALSLLRLSQMLLLLVAVAAATSFPMLLGKILWPRGLSAGTELLFWPETGVAVSGLLLFGWHRWPAVLLGVFIPDIWIKQDLPGAFFNACGNTLEALAAWGLLNRAFPWDFAHWKTVGTLLLAAVLAPSLSAIPGVLIMVHREIIPLSEMPQALGVWWLANGSAMLLLVPFFMTLRPDGWSFPTSKVEAALWLGAGLGLGWWAFEAVFRAQGVNLAFIVFPFVIYAAVRFGPPETSVALVVVMGAIYLAMARHARSIVPATTIQTLWFLQAFSFILASTGLAVAALVQERRRAEASTFEQSKQSLEISLRAEQAQLEALRYQINPHFLFNTLNSLRATLPHDAETSRAMVTGIAEYLRSILARPGQNTAALRDEIHSLRGYLAIEQTRFEENLRVSFLIDPATDNAEVPIFLLQPLVENAIRHGFAVCPPPYDLRIEAAASRGRLVLEVTNSGVWLQAGEAERPGLGLGNIRERLRLLYGQDAFLRIKPENGRVRAWIEMPLKEASL